MSGERRVPTSLSTLCSLAHRDMEKHTVNCLSIAAAPALGNDPVSIRPLHKIVNRKDAMSKELVFFLLSSCCKIVEDDSVLQRSLKSMAQLQLTSWIQLLAVAKCVKQSTG